MFAERLLKALLFRLIQKDGYWVLVKLSKVCWQRLCTDRKVLYNGRYIYDFNRSVSFNKKGKNEEKVEKKRFLEEESVLSGVCMLILVK